MQAIVAGAAKADPDLAEIVRLAREVVAVERQPGGALDPRTPSTFKISDLKTPLRAYLFYRKNPLLTYAIPVGILALAFVLGRVSAGPVIPLSREKR
jgi:hypothetical protein